MISFIYFDVGGVLTLDFSGTSKWTDLKRKWGITESQDAEFDAFWNTFEADACIGNVPADWWHTMNLNFGTQFSAEYDLIADFVQWFEPNPDLAQLLPAIKARYQIGLLTNMYPGMLTQISHRQLLPQVKWNTVIDSSVVGFRKPQPEIFTLAQNQVGLPANEILFVENSSGNISAAAATGWQTLLYDPQNISESNHKLIHILNLS